MTASRSVLMHNPRVTMHHVEVRVDEFQQRDCHSKRLLRCSDFKKRGGNLCDPPNVTVTPPGTCSTCSVSSAVYNRLRYIKTCSSLYL